MIKTQPVWWSPAVPGGGAEEALAGLLVARLGFKPGVGLDVNSLQGRKFVWSI